MDMYITFVLPANHSEPPEMFACPFESGDHQLSIRRMCGPGRTFWNDAHFTLLKASRNDFWSEKKVLSWRGFCLRESR